MCRISTLLCIEPDGINAKVIVDILENFTNLSGYKLKILKSLLIPADGSDRGYSEFPFEIECSLFPYLGNRVTNEIEILEKHDFKSLVGRTKQDFGKWSTLPISLACHIKIVKITVLP